MIESLSELKKLLKLCREQGVQKIEFDNVKLELGDLPIEAQHSVASSEPETPYAGFPQGELTPEQLMFYSAGGHPDNDPELIQEAI